MSTKTTVDIDRLNRNRRKNGEFGESERQAPKNQTIGGMSDEQYAEWTSDADELADLSLHSDSWVRTLVARNLHTPDEMVERLKGDKSPGVRRAAFLRDDTTSDELETGWKSGALSPTDVAGHPASNAETIAAAARVELADEYAADDLVNFTVHNLMTHENADNDTFRAAIESPRTDLTTLAVAIEKTSNPDDLQKAAERLSESNQNDPQIVGAWEALAGNDSADEMALDLVPHTTEDVSYDLTLAQNQNLSYARFSELVESLDESPDRVDLARFLAKNPSLPDAGMIVLASHPDAKVRAVAA
ncbi:hypothetical protein [Aeromicrobium sp. 179-A 4D2 NHS]|uniref:hypothetical protein n=1 Tax=Aeromicrobium sp. 179-A 4D2 NHS TaxID=3142375 RepID=UPI0039A28E2F